MRMNFAEPPRPDADLDQPAEDDGREQVFEGRACATSETTTTAIAPVAPEIMPGPTADDGGDQAEEERGVKPDDRRHARDERERDRFGHQGQRDGQAGQGSRS